MTKTVESRFVLRGDNQLTKAFGKAQKQVEELSKKAGVFSAAAITGAAAIVKHQAEVIDQMAKTSEVVGVSIEALQAYRHEAELSGIANQGMDDSLRRLNRRAGEFANSGGGPAAAAFKTLGIEVRDASGKIKGTEQLFEEILDNMQGVATDGQKAALAAQLFGDDFGPKLVPLINKGNDAIRASRKELEDLGILITQSEAAGVERMNDAFVRSGKLISGVSQKFTATLAPAIEAIVNHYMDMAKASREAGDSVSISAESVAHGLFFVVDVVDSVGRTFKVVANASIISFEIIKSGVLDLADSIVNGPNRALDLFLHQLDQIPGVDIDFRFGDAVQLANDKELSVGIIQEAVAAIDAILLKPLPSEGLKAKFAQIKEELASLPQVLVDAGGFQAGSDKITQIIDDLEKRVREFGLDAPTTSLLEALGLGATPEQAAALVELGNQLRALQEKATQAKEDAKERNELEKEYAQLIESTRTPVEEHAAMVQRIVELWGAGLFESVEEYEQVLMRVNAEFVKSQEKVGDLDEFTKQAARNLESYFADFLFDPFDDGLKGMLRGFAQTIQRMAAEAAAAAILKSIFGDSSSGGGLSGFLSGLFGGARAEGGPVSAGSAYLVGERGPELIVPRANGTVIPNNQMGGTNVTVNIDARESDNPARLMALVPLITHEVEKSVKHKSRRGYL